SRKRTGRQRVVKRGFSRAGSTRDKSVAYGRVGGGAADILREGSSNDVRPVREPESGRPIIHVNDYYDRTSKDLLPPLSPSQEGVSRLREIVELWRTAHDDLQSYFLWTNLFGSRPRDCLKR